MSCIHNDLQLFTDLVRRGSSLMLKASARCSGCGTAFEFPKSGGGSTVELSMPIRPVQHNGIGMPQPRVEKLGATGATGATAPRDDPALRPADDIPDLDDLDDAEELEPSPAAADQ